MASRKKLSLATETLRRLDPSELSQVQGLGTCQTTGCQSEQCQTFEASVCYTHCYTAHPCGEDCWSLPGTACTNCCGPTWTAECLPSPSC